MCTVAAAVITGCANTEVEFLDALQILIISLSFRDMRKLTTFHLFVIFSTLIVMTV